MYLDLADDDYRRADRNRTRRMAVERLPAGALSPAPRHVAAARSRARRVNRGPLAAPQSLQSRRFHLGDRPRGPYPLLTISGEQGSAKTVLSKTLKALVDPNVAPVRAMPREERELMIGANNGYLRPREAWLLRAM
jgi:hypothetical protein